MSGRSRWAQPGAEVEPAELALEVRERRASKSRRAHHLGEEDVVRRNSRLLGDAALERGHGLVEQGLAPLAGRGRHAVELVSALLGEALRQAGVAGAEDVDRKVTRRGDRAAGLGLAVQAD